MYVIINIYTQEIKVSLILLLVKQNSMYIFYKKLVNTQTQIYIRITNKCV